MSGGRVVFGAELQVAEGKVLLVHLVYKILIKPFIFLQLDIKLWMHEARYIITS